MSDVKKDAVKKVATREAYGNALAEFGEAYPDMVVLDADLAAATKTGVFKKKFPERHIDCGIAEANMMGIAAGLSLTGMQYGGNCGRTCNHRQDTFCQQLCHVCGGPGF